MSAFDAAERAWERQQENAYQRSLEIAEAREQEIADLALSLESEVWRDAGDWLADAVHDELTESDQFPTIEEIVADPLRNQRAAELGAAFLSFAEGVVERLARISAEREID
jgi:hypothetical protein